MWIVARYAPVALFSLKTAAATSSGGKTLLCPTPFAIKMALLDAALRTSSVAQAKLFWPQLRDLRIQISLSERITVINTFAKIVRPKKNGVSDDSGTGLLTPFGSTIAYREYVQFSSPFTLALQTTSGDSADLAMLLQQINYFGRRGGFVQLVKLTQATVLDEVGFVALTEDQQAFNADGTLQMLDDCGPTMTFAHADIYSGKRITLGKERILRHIVLPYRATRSSRGFTLYERIDV